MPTHEAAQTGLLRDGDLVLSSAFGAGIAWGGSGLRW